MKHELAKQLKNAGFPITHTKTEYRHPNGEPYPTLEELIEACGDGFGGISRDTKGNWISYSIKASSMNDAIDGSTPSEAVAKLWLELNKEKHD